jgi:hypothetical protein
MELFALGGLSYQLISGNVPYHHLGDGPRDVAAIEARYAAGDFQDDVWGFKTAVRVLGYWSPPFAEELVRVRLEWENSTYFCLFYCKHRDWADGCCHSF